MSRGVWRKIITFAVASDRANLSTEEAAELIGCSPWWLKMRRKEIGTGPDFFRIGRRLVKYRRSDVDQWIEAQRNKPG